MLKRDGLLVIAAAGLALSFLAVIGAGAQAPGPPSAGGQAGGVPMFLDQRRLPGAGASQVEEDRRQAAQAEARRRAQAARLLAAEKEKARRLTIEAELEKLRRLTAEAEARLKSEEARRKAAEEETKRLAAEAERAQAEEARRAAALAKAKQDAAKSKTEGQRLRAEAELKRRAAAEKRRLEQQRAIAAEAEPAISPQAARALAAKADAKRKAEERRLIGARAARIEARRLADEARKRKQAKQAKAPVPQAGTTTSGQSLIPASNPALSRYSAGLDDEFDAMEAGLEEEIYDGAAPPAAVAGSTGTSVGTAITSSAVAAPLPPTAKVRPAVTVQNCQLVSESIEQGFLKLQLKTSASTKGAVTARVGGVVHQAKLAPNGNLLLAVPLLSRTSAVEWTFPGNSRCTTALRPATPPNLLQVALVWQGNADLNMHVLEPGAWMGGLYGHIWPRQPNSQLQAGAGRLSVFGTPGSGTRMHVYSVDPRNIGRRRILNVLVDFTARGRPPFCSGGASGRGQTVTYDVHIYRPPGGLAPAGTEVRSFEFAPKPCGTLVPARQRYEKLSLRP